MLKANLIGNLGADAVVRHHNGSQAIGFSVAHNEKFKDSKGVTNEKTLWVNCTFWRTKDTALTDFLKKGQLVYVEGIPSVSVYTNREGRQVADFALRVTNIQLLGGRSDKYEQPAAAQENGQARQRPQNGQRKRPQPQSKVSPPRTQQQAPTTPVDDMEVPAWIRD